ncbi:hypothetical protein C8F04DRAFT_1405868 [Mycena alexandri]|uniref:Uncharacterized protein n=1 Tax=Mycena alexandri TaxID=1745969 RepID=A0AAD6WKR4_9AGAR|nr:hypothetical protein C8F04DRAFT_1405868 [Mycena alexandri]
MSTSASERSLFVTLAAQAMSSVGFSVSLVLVFNTGPYYPYGNTPQTLETWRESAVESDSSNSSPRPSLSLSRTFRTRRSSGTSVPDVTPIITAPTSDSKHGRKGSGSFIPPWAFRRASGSKNAVASPSTTTTAPAAPSSSPSLPLAPTPSYFTRKASRRVSTPVPRTQPYAHPYYAQPPIEDDPSIAHLRSQPQFGLSTEREYHHHDCVRF